MKYLAYVLLLNLLATGLAMAEQNLKRLFYSAQERAQIDRQKPAADKNTVNNKAPKQNIDVVELKGYLIRKGQPDVVWVNSENTLKTKKPITGLRVLKVQKSGNVAIKRDGQSVVNLKPGQFVLANQKTVRERYEKSDK
ncbi:MAG: hypothetical protein OEY36_03690 [Gammaproteobacteria bacterium]|nr:hypothetical protein [Gammaproteobacteria bacterium]